MMEKIRSCRDCANFEDVNGIPVCAKHHSPRVACDGFRSRLDESNKTQQNNLMKTAILDTLTSTSTQSPIPVYVINIARRKKW